MKQFQKRIGLFLLIAVISISCSKEAGMSKMQVRMKDAPGDYQEVLVDVVGLEVQLSESENESGWIVLEVNDSIYNLLDLTAGVSIVLADKQLIPSGKVGQMRLILGDSNSVKISDTYYPLATPSGQNTGLKFNVNHEFETDRTYEVFIDFDANESVVEEGNGAFSLKPVITVESVTEID